MGFLKVISICITIILAVCAISTEAVDDTTLKCWECNVWKAGYGHLCDNPRVVEGCTVCMKIETTIYMGYYKNKPRSSTIITRLCGNDYTPQFGNECLTYKMVDGYSKRCFCESEFCNGAIKQSLGVVLPVVLLSTILAIYYSVF